MSVSRPVLSTVICTEDSPHIETCDTIEHEGALWLVPDWLSTLDGEWRAPVRIIRLDTLPHQKAPMNYDADYVLNFPLPKAVLDGEMTPELLAVYTVVDRPDILVPSPKLN